MKITKILCLWVLTLFAVTFADEELYYDNGIAHDTFIMGQNGIYVVTKFSPSQYPAKLMKIKYYMPKVNETTAFKLSILPADLDGKPWDGNDLVEPFVISGGHAGWNEYDLGALDLNVDDDFFFVLSQNPNNFFAIGVDDQEPISLHSYDTDC